VRTVVERSRRSPGRRADVEMRYLVIQTRDIGDVMLSTALCNALNASHPDARVDMLTMDHCRGVVDGNPNIDEVIVLVQARRNNVLYMFNFLRRLRAKKYDVIVNVQGQLIGLMSCLCSLSSRRVGMDTFPWSLAHTDNVVFHSQPQASGECDTIDDRFNLLVPLGIEIESRSYHLWLDDAEVQAGRELLETAGVDMTRPIVALGVNSRDDYKQWPLEHFARLASWLIDEFDAQIYVFFGPGEEQYSKRLKSLLPEDRHPSVFDDIRTRSIRELGTVFSHCTLYLGNDTGPRHVAQSLDLPAFAVVSPVSNKRGWVPWNNPRFRAVDSGDAMGMTYEEWDRISYKLTPGVDDGEWFAKLTPEFVQTRLTEMIDELGLF
jgi:heptosyltransferase-3